MLSSKSYKEQLEEQGVKVFIAPRPEFEDDWPPEVGDFLPDQFMFYRDFYTYYGLDDWPPQEERAVCFLLPPDKLPEAGVLAELAQLAFRYMEYLRGRERMKLDEMNDGGR